jgi:2,4'-dihydroxyacetophenone dioxygenase
MNMQMNQPPGSAGTLVTCDAKEMQWLPWAMRGAHFKLLNADPGSGRFALMIKFDPGTVAPVHRHVGAVEGYILEGSFHYRDEPHIRFSAGCYLLENAGAVHQPESPEGALMFAVFHGPVEGLKKDGNVAATLDWKWHVDTWNAAHNDAQQ